MPWPWTEATSPNSSVACSWESRRSVDAPTPPAAATLGPGPERKQRPVKRYLALVSIASLAALAPACGGDTDNPGVTPTPETAVRHEKTSPPTPTPTAGVTPEPSPRAKAPATPGSTLKTPTPTAPAPRAEWVRDRLTAAANLYGISREGRDLLQRLDVRQMRGQPGFFGSYGYKGWTGVGEAKPAPVMHELSHAYWGAFPVSGSPGLSWEPEGDEPLSLAMQRYHEDVLEFMRQPPGHYELFRSRLRNIPELRADNLDGLFHSVEADVVGNVAGDLLLVPPILRKYWDRFLEPGPWGTWYEAAAWLQALSGTERPLADQYTGFAHLDLRPYGRLRPAGPVQLGPGVAEALGREERQRLWDFTDQFDLLLGEPDYRENFDFWRGYLRDMQRLHRLHAGYLDLLQTPRARPIAEALDTLEDLEGQAPEDRARAIVRGSADQPFLTHFLPALDNKTLLAYFAAEAPLPGEATLKGTVAFVERLGRFGPEVDKVLDLGRRNVDLGADALTRILESQDFENKRDLNLFVELLRDADDATTRQVAAALDDSMIRRLIRAVPAALRSVIEPKRLLTALGIGPGSGPVELVTGIDMLVTYPSGNFLIDEPYLAELYTVTAAIAHDDAAEALGVIRDSAFPMRGFVRAHPRDAAAILSSDLETAVGIVERSDPVTFPPARLVYSLIQADPDLAARLVERLYDRGNVEQTVEALAHFAYDVERLAAVPELAVSLANDGRFLERLLADMGSRWLEEMLLEAIRVYAVRMERGDMPEGFLQAYRSTLEASIATLPEGSSTLELQRIVGLSFSDPG